MKKDILLALARTVPYLMGRVKGSFFDSNGVKIHYTDEGSGEPVVLVHGYGADADNNWRIPGVTQVLKKDYRVIALDNRGHGLSDKPHDPDMYGVEMVKDIPRLLDHLGIEKAHVVGYSMGGFITLKLITMFPERLLSAAPCGAGWDQPTSDNMKLLLSIADSLDQGKGFGPLLISINQMGKTPNGFVIKLVDAIMKWLNDIPALAATMRRFADLAVTEEELRKNTVPVLSIVGSVDPLRAGVDKMIGVMANHEAVYIEGGDHMTALDSRYIQALTAFLAKHSTS